MSWQQWGVLERVHLDSGYYVEVPSLLALHDMDNASTNKEVKNELTKPFTMSLKIQHENIWKSKNTSYCSIWLPCQIGIEIPDLVVYIYQKLPLTKIPVNSVYGIPNYLVF